MRSWLLAKTGMMPRERVLATRTEGKKVFGHGREKLTRPLGWLKRAIHSSAALEKLLPVAAPCSRRREGILENTDLIMPGDSGHEQTLRLLWYKSLVALQLYSFCFERGLAVEVGIGPLLCWSGGRRRAMRSSSSSVTLLNQFNSRCGRGFRCHLPLSG